MKSKYRYNTPNNTKEHIEALYEQTQLTKEKGFNSEYTIRDVLENIAQHLQQQNTISQRKNDSTIFSERFSHISCAVIGCILFFGAKNMSESFSWANESILVFSGLISWLIFLSISLERQSFFKFIWQFGVVKFIASIGFAGLIIHASAISSSTINSVFGVDASSFIYTQSMLTGILMFKIFTPIFWFILASCIFHALVVLAEWKQEIFRLEPIMYLLVSFFISLFVIVTMSDVFKDEELRFKAYKLAHLYDFNDKIHCIDEEKLGIDTVGIYLGSSHDKYLLDSKVNLNEEIKDFIFTEKKDSNIHIPDTFTIGKCE